MVTFKQTTIDVGTITPKETIFINFPFEGSGKDILTATPSCGCISDWSVVGNNFQVKFTESDYEKLSDWDRSLLKDKPRKITKYITVYFKQNHTTLYTIDPATGQKTMNGEAPNVILHFTVNLTTK